MSALFLQAAPAASVGGYGWELLRAVIALIGVCLLAWVVLRFAARRGVGLGSSRGPMRVIDRVVMEGRHSLYLVRVGERVLLIGSGPGAAPRLLTEIDPEALDPHTASDPSHKQGLREARTSTQASELEDPGTGDER